MDRFSSIGHSTDQERTFISTAALMEIRLQQTYKQTASTTFDEQSAQKQQVKTGD